MLDNTGKLWITDFGLARIEQDASITMTGDLLGTVSTNLVEITDSPPNPYGYRFPSPLSLVCQFPAGKRS